MVKSRVAEWWARAYVSWDCREVAGEGVRVVGSVAEWWAGACVVEWGRGRYIGGLLCEFIDRNIAKWRVCRCRGDESRQ